MIPIIFFFHDPFHIIRPGFTPFLLTETQLSTTSSQTPSTSLLFVFNPFTSLNIPLRQLFNSVSASLAFSLIAFGIALFFMLLGPLYFTWCYSSSYFPQFFSYTLPYVHISFLMLSPSPRHSSTMYLLPFFSHILSHAFNTPSLKCPHKFGAPISTNWITFS